MRAARWLIVVSLLSATLSSGEPPEGLDVRPTPRLGAEGGVLANRLSLGLSADVGVAVRAPRWEYRVTLGVFGFYTERHLQFGEASGSLFGVEGGVDLRWRATRWLAFGLGGRAGVGHRTASGSIRQGSPSAVGTDSSAWLTLLRGTLSPFIVRFDGARGPELEAFLTLTFTSGPNEQAASDLALPLTGGVRLSWPLALPPISPASSPSPRPPLLAALAAEVSTFQSIDYGGSLAFGVELPWRLGTLRPLVSLDVLRVPGAGALVHGLLGGELLFTLDERLSVGFGAGLGGGFTGYFATPSLDPHFAPLLLARVSAVPLALTLDAQRRFELAVLLRGDVHLAVFIGAMVDNGGVALPFQAASAAVRFGVRL